MATKKVTIGFHDGRPEMIYPGVARIDVERYDYQLFDDQNQLLASLNKGDVKNLMTHREE